MIKKTIVLWNTGEYDYKNAFGFEPDIRVYLHEEGIRPAILICPGGGYLPPSPTEAEPIAETFYQMGYNTFVLTYTGDPLASAPLIRQPVNDLSRAVRLLRYNAPDLQIDSERLYVMGFSAGGHLAGSLGVYSREISDPNPDYSGISNRPDALILCYPVISSTHIGHASSFQRLAGDDRETAEYFSLEKHVPDDMPPTFLWHTQEDDVVPVENALLMCTALQEKKIPFTLHIFEKGGHGLSLANERMAAGDFGDNYTKRQVYLIRDLEQSGKITLSPQEAELLHSQLDEPAAAANREERHKVPNQEAMGWPVLVDTWLKKREGFCVM